MIYLASPYSHPDKRVEEQRFIETRRFVWTHLATGVPLFSPIVYAHQFAVDFSAPSDAEGWKQINDAWLERCDACWILALPGWQSSLGVTYETKLANSLGLEIKIKSPLK